MFMKKYLSLLLFVLFIFLYSRQAEAQLSGTKVIGTSPSDYTTFAAAVSALNSQGVNGNVIFNVKPNTYTERISINQISGAGPNKTITFQSLSGDSTSVTLQYASSGSALNNYVIQLNGADYITFKNMTIKRTDTLAYSVVIDVKSGARRNTFANNIIKGNIKKSTYTYRALVTSDNVGKDCFNTFKNNIFRNGDFGIYFLGQGSNQPDSGNVITNNRFIDQAYRGLYFTSQLWLSVKGNTITSNAQNTSFYGIYAQYSNDTMRISKNKISLLTGYGIYLTNCDETVANEGLIANNFIAVGGISTAYGIYISQSKHQQVIFNSINISSTHATSGVALNLTGASTEFVTIKNNALANTGGGYSCFVASTVPSTVISSSDFNDLYTTGSYIGSWKTTSNITTLANWRTASTFETHSVSADPIYTSAIDLHAHNGALNAAATTNIAPIVIKDDIDDNSRHIATPDIGADEFSTEDIGIGSIMVNDAGYCPSTSFNIAVRIHNYSIYDFNGAIPLRYQIAGNAPVNALTTMMYIAAGDSLLYTFASLQSINTSGSYHINAGTYFSADINTMNDTTGRELLIHNLPAINFSGNQSICLGDSITLTASGGTTYLWSVSPPNTSASITVAPVVPTNYSITVVSLEGCIDSAEVTVTPVSFPATVASFNYIPAGLQLSFTSTSTDATTYSWDFGDGGSSPAQNPIHNYSVNGTYTIRLIASNPCSADTTQQQVGVVGMAENTSETSLHIGPNPAQDMIFVYYNKAAFYEILNCSGQIVQSATLSNRGIDISKLSPDLYFIRLIDEKGRMYKGKFVKE
jgi:parallel beta-helix repeat protein